MGAGLDKKWLLGKLSENNFTGIKDVFYAGLDTSGNLYISSRNMAKEKEGQYGIE